jgi:pSer/pThr/pTyr-binding forkhead associated (FHA) protein
MTTNDRKLDPQLVETTGAHEGRVHELPYGEHVVGRGGTVSIRLDDHDVSRRHARLVVDAHGVWVHDLGSKNGVYANGRRVTDPVQLGHGDTLSFGDLVLRLSHPASQVSRALRNAGETTMTTTHTEDDRRRSTRPTPNLWLPLLGIAVFGTLVVLMLLR